MNLWIVLFSILLPVQPQLSQPGVSIGPSDGEPLRYRGIEQLLAKFEAEAQ